MNGSFFPRLIIVSGPSGVGKSTILHKVLSTMDHVKISISCTTREPRSGEIDGHDYFFVDRERFQSMIAKGAFLEWAEVYGNYYGTTKQHVLEILGQPQHALLDVDTQGALHISQNCTGVLMVFILPPSMEELRRRLTNRRTESAESLQRRLSWAESEMTFAHRYDETIINSNIQYSAIQLAEIIKRAEQEPIPFRINWETKEMARHSQDAVSELASGSPALDRDALVQGIVSGLHDTLNSDMIDLIQERVDKILQNDLEGIVADVYQAYMKDRA